MSERGFLVGTNLIGKSIDVYWKTGFLRRKLHCVRYVVCSVSVDYLGYPQILAQNSSGILRTLDLSPLSSPTYTLRVVN